MLNGVYKRSTEGEPVFVEVPAPSDEVLRVVPHKIITRMMKLLTWCGALVEDQGSSDMADNDGNSDDSRTLRRLQAAACTYGSLRTTRGQKVVTVCTRSLASAGWVM